MEAKSHATKRRGAVAIVIRDGRLLVIRRSRWVRAPRAHCFPGGGIEAGETEPQALVREMEEELGVTVQPVRRVWECTTSWGVPLVWWLAEMPSEAELMPNPAEVESFCWCTPEEISHLPNLLTSNRDFLACLGQGLIDLS